MGIYDWAGKAGSRKIWERWRGRKDNKKREMSEQE
jgi:hypothetical protein